MLTDMMKDNVGKVLLMILLLINFIYLFYLSIFDIECYISFSFTTYWLDNSIHDTMLTLVNILTIPHYYNIVDYILYAVLFFYMTYSFFNWKLVTLNSFYVFHLSSHLPHPLWQPPVYTWYLRVYFLLLLFLCLLICSSSFDI